MRTHLISDMRVKGYEVTRGMQCMILGSCREGCPRTSVAMWLHYWTRWPVRDCDRVVDSVMAACCRETQPAEGPHPRIREKPP